MKKTNKSKKAESLAMLITLIVLTILLCIPFFNKIFIGIFGFTSYAYMASLYCMLYCYSKNYKISLPKKRVVLYIILFFCFILTLHIFFAKDLINDGIGSYVIDTFTTNTVGGMIVSIISCIIVVPMGYLVSVIVFFLLTATLGFIAIFPHLIKNKSGYSKKHDKEKEIKKEKTIEVENIEQRNLKIIDFDEEEKEVSPLTREEFVVEPKPLTKENAREVLFNNEKPQRVQIIPRRRPAVAELKLQNTRIEEKPIEKNPYQILPNFDATRIKPQDKVYTNSFLKNNKDKNAKEVLFDTSLKEDYKIRYGEESSDISRKKFLEDNNIQQVSTNTYSKKINENIPLEKNVTEEKKEITQTNSYKKESEITDIPKVEYYHKKPYVSPHPGLLEKHDAESFSNEITDFEKYKNVLETTLGDFGITANVVGVIKGPTVTRYELKLAQGTGNSVNKVLNLQKDLKMVLEAEGEINILAPIRGKNAIGIEIPNKNRGIVTLRETICTQEFQKDTKGIKLALGKTIDGKPFIPDLEEMPHLLVAGATGTGKSVCINTIITSILFQHSPEEVKLLLIDPKKVELINYINLPHLLIKEPLVEIKEIVAALKWIREETSQRFNKFRDLRVVNINAYNAYAKEYGKELIPKIVIVIDEASELMTKAKKEVEETLSSLARIGRAAGVHLIFATQSPTKNVITSEIQNNLNTKIAVAVRDYVHSQVIFKANGAEKLLGKGDMFLKGSGGELTRLQCSYVSPQEIQRVVEFIMQHNESRFDDNIAKQIVCQDDDIEKENDFQNAKSYNAGFLESVKEALKLTLKMNRISTSLLQRRMEKGYNGAAKIIDYLEEKGYISPPDSSNKKREIYITMDQFLAMYPEEREEMQENE